MKFLPVLAVFCLAAEASGQNLQLPQSPRAWINSPPVTIDTLKGKGVVFYFFEEG